MDDITSTPVEKPVPSCAECRRRKARCDRANPCDNCARFGRHCSYEKVSRTPLTRRHLSHVEQELARTRALLRKYEDNNPPPATSAVNCSNEEEALQHIADEARESESLIAPNQPQQTITPLNAVRNRSVHTVTASMQGNAVDDLTFRGQSTTANYTIARPASPAFSLETSPASADFDWDERAKKISQAQFIDGMASLTEQRSRGYMGVASGAALLRLADNTAESGVDMEHYHQDDSTQETPSIPNRFFSLSQLEPFVDAYFQTYHISYPIVHEATFRAQFMEVIPRPKGNAWQVLLYIIAALGSFAASTVAPEIDVELFEAAKARLSIDMLETGNMTLVQALTLMSNYVQKRNKPNSGYNYLGLAKRMAMGIGLHKEFPAWHSNPLRLEIRRRVYWCLYIFDVGATITFSRPLDLPREGIEIQLPLNVADGDITTTTKRFPPEVQEATLYTHVRSQSQFHLATSGIYARLISTPFPSAAEMLEADDSHLGKWLQDTPSYYQEGVTLAPKFRLSHSILQWRWRNFRILMCRPFLMRRFMTKRQNTGLPDSPYDDSAIQRCLEAAAESIQLIGNYWQCGTQNVMACWYSLYFLFQATLIPVICLRNEPHSALAGGWRTQISSALETISDMTRLNSAASLCHNVIMKLCGPYLAQDISQWNSPTSESPLTQLNALNSFMWPMTDPQLSNGYDFAFLESVPIDFVSQFSM